MYTAWRVDRGCSRMLEHAKLPDLIQAGQLNHVQAGQLNHIQVHILLVVKKTTKWRDILLK